MDAKTGVESLFVFPVGLQTTKGEITDGGTAAARRSRLGPSGLLSGVVRAEPR